LKYKIKGAGPAGLAAAIKLAQKGYSVDVFEKAYSPGGGIGSNIQAMRSYGSDEKILETFSNEGLKINKMHPIFKIKKYAPSLKFDMLYSKSTPIFYTFHRGKTKNSLDVQLVEQAEREGVNIHFGKSISLNNSNIIASGSGFDPVGVGYGSEFKGKLKDNETISFFFGDKDVPHGYGYIAPFGTDELTIAITSFRQSDFANTNILLGERQGLLIRLEALESNMRCYQDYLLQKQLLLIKIMIYYGKSHLKKS